jgi:hypothetical protein
LSLCFPLCLSLSVSAFSSSVTPPSVSSAVHPASVVSSTLLSPLSPCHLFSPYFHFSSILASISSISSTPCAFLSVSSPLPPPSTLSLCFPLSLSPLLTLGYVSLHLSLGFYLPALVSFPLSLSL